MNSVGLLWKPNDRVSLALTEVVPDIQRYVGARYIEGVHDRTDSGSSVVGIQTSGDVSRNQSRVMSVTAAIVLRRRTAIVLRRRTATMLRRRTAVCVAGLITRTAGLFVSHGHSPLQK
jgi:hypothetical protein